MTLSDIRCTVNSESICSADLIEVAEEIAADIEGQITRESIAEACDLPIDCGAITSHVVSLIANRAACDTMRIEVSRTIAGQCVVLGCFRPYTAGAMDSDDVDAIVADGCIGDLAECCEWQGANGAAYIPDGGDEYEILD